MKIDNPLVIALEGCDRVGKTTLAKKLAKHFKAEYRHIKFKSTSEEPEKQKQEMKDFNFSILTECCETEVPIIYDRFLYGEYVYGHLRGYKVNYLFNNAWSLPANTLLIHVDTDASILIPRFEDEIQKVENVETILKRFRYAYMHAPSFHKISLFNDFTENFFNNSMMQITNYLDMYYE